jgi:hypothetical protein
LVSRVRRSETEVDRSNSTRHHADLAAEPSYWLTSLATTRSATAGSVGIHPPKQRRGRDAADELRDEKTRHIYRADAGERRRPRTGNRHGWIGERRWTAVEYMDRGESGAKDRRPQLDRLVADAKRRRFDVLVRWKLDRLGRNLRHLILMIDDLHALGVSFVSLSEGPWVAWVPAERRAK